MAETRDRSASSGAAPRGRQVHFGVGSASAAVRLISAAILTGLLILAVAEKWPWYVDIVIGVIWAFVFALGVVVPMVSGFIADALSQQSRAPAVKPRAAAPAPEDGWGERSHPLRRASDIGLYVAPTKGMLARPTVAASAPGFDWLGLMQGVASLLEDALGEGFQAEAADGTSLMLRHGEQMSRRVNLRMIFQPPPLDVTERAMRGCLKMMDEAQMFAMRVHREPWPSRTGTTETGPGNLPRPQVRLEDGRIAMSWADSLGTMLRLQPLSFDSDPPKRPDAKW